MSKKSVVNGQGEEVNGPVETKIMSKNKIRCTYTQSSRQTFSHPFIKSVRSLLIWPTACACDNSERLWKNGK